MTSLAGEWKDLTAGGSVNSALTFVRNPQYFLSSETAAEVVVSLEQDLTNWSKAPGIALYVFSSGGRKVDVLKADEIVANSKGYSPKEKIELPLMLPALAEHGHAYTIVASRFEAGQEGSFTLSVHARTPVSLVGAVAYEDPTLKYQQHVTLKDAWSGASAGGCQNHPSVVDNPQYSLSAPDDGTEVMIVLRQTSTSHAIGVCLAVCDGKRLSDNHDQSNDVTSAFVALPEVSITCVLPSSVVYTICPSTFLPNCEGAFELDVHSTQPVDVAPMATLGDAYPHSKSVSETWSGDKAGGCLNFPSASMNPQFALSVTEPLKVLITLEQTGSTRFFIGLHVANKGGAPAAFILPSERVAQTPSFTNALSCSVEATLQPTEKPYTVFASTFEPGQEAPFVLTVRASGPGFHLCPLDRLEERASHPRHKEVVVGRWQGESAGGCVNFTTVVCNPQFIVTADQDTNVRVSLSCIPHDSAVLPAIGVFLADTGGEKIERSTDSSCFIGSSGSFVSAAKVVTPDIMVPSKRPISLLPCTFNAGVEGDFTINIESDHPVRIVPAATHATEGSVTVAAQATSDLASESESDGEDEEMTAEDAAQHAKEPETDPEGLHVSGSADTVDSAEDQGGRWKLETHADHAIAELLTSEEVYVSSLRTLIEQFIVPLRDLSSDPEKCIVSRDDMSLIFGYFENIYIFNCDMLLAQLSTRYTSRNLCTVKVSDVLEQRLPAMKKFYMSYVSMYQQRLEENTKAVASNSKYRAYCDEARRARNIDVMSFLVMPVQRVPRYQLLVKEILKHTTPDTYPDHEALARVQEELSTVASAINTAISNAENFHKMCEIQARFVGPSLNLAAPGRVFLREGYCLVSREKRGSKTRRRRMAFFLFNNCAVICRSLKDNNALLDMRVQSLDGALIISDDSADDGDFTVVFSPELSWHIQCAYKREKYSWTVAIKDALAKLQESESDKEERREKFSKMLVTEPLMMSALESAAGNELFHPDRVDAFVLLFEKHGRSRSLLEFAVECDIRLSGGEVERVFRGQNFGSLILSGFMRAVGSNYLSSILLATIAGVLGKDEDYELDPSRMSGSAKSSRKAAAKNAVKLEKRCRMTASHFIGSLSECPPAVALVVSVMAAGLQTAGVHAEACAEVIAAFLVQRFLCPAIVSPVKHGIAKDKRLDIKQQRGLMLIAKVLQTAASGTEFGDKEEYMTCMNPFIKSVHPELLAFANALMAGSTADQQLFVVPTASYQLARQRLLVCARQNLGALAGEDLAAACPGMTALIEKEEAGEPDVASGTPTPSDVASWKTVQQPSEKKDKAWKRKSFFHK